MVSRISTFSHPSRLLSIFLVPTSTAWSLRQPSKSLSKADYTEQHLVALPSTQLPSLPCLMRPNQIQTPVSVYEQPLIRSHEEAFRLVGPASSAIVHHSTVQ